MEAMIEWIKIEAGFLTVATLLIGVGVWLGRISANQRNFKDFMKEVKTDLREINDKLLNILSKPKRDVIDTRSPLQLNDLGKKIWKELDASKWVERFGQATKTSFNNKDSYEIQEFCFRYVQTDEIYSDEETRRIREMAYDNGMSEFDVRRVIGIKFRDTIVDVVQST